MTATLDGTAEEVIVRGEVTMQLPQNGAIHTFQLTFQDGALRQEPFRNGVVSCSAHSGCGVHLATGDDSSTSPMGIEKKALTGHCRVRLYILMLDRK